MPDKLLSLPQRTRNIKLVSVTLSQCETKLKDTYIA